MAGPSPTYEDYRSVRYFSSLDGFRFASILAVVFHHTLHEWAWFPASRHGFLGVDMFFVISGFLIVTLLLRERDRDDRISLRRFYARRGLRIFPLYYTILFALALVFLFVMPDSNSADPFLDNLPYHLTYTVNWIHTPVLLAVAWSLAAEEQFYLCWPPVEKWLGERRVMLLLTAFIALNQMINFGLLDGLLDGWFGVDRGDYRMLQITFTPICLGVLLAHVLHHHGGYALAIRWLGHRWSPLLMLALLLALCSLPGPLRGWPRLAIQVAMMLLLCTCVVREDHNLRGILTLEPIRRVGMISYGIYLYHMLVLHFVTIALESLSLDSPYLLFLVGLLLTIIIAELSFRFYERPFLMLKTLFRSHRIPQPTGAAKAPARY